MQPPATTSCQQQPCQPATSNTSANTTYGSEHGGDHSSSCQPAEAAPEQTLPAAFHLSVPHIRQDYNWDCGLACALMALRAFGQHHYDMPALRRLCPTKSVWTIDLAHLLRACGVGVQMLTAYAGANPCYAGERFYAENMAEDEARVARLFQEAPAAGISVQQRTIQLEELQRLMLAGRHLVIALVDKSRLSPGGGAMGASLPVLAPMLAGGGAAAVLEPPYTGHYVLLSGYDSCAGEFQVCDPASAREVVRMPAATLHAARRSFGTDEDLLLLSIPSGLQRAGALSLVGD